MITTGRSTSARVTATAAVTMTTVASTTHVMRRCTNLHVQLRLVLEFVGLKCNQVREHIVEGECLSLGHHGGDEGIIGGRETYE
jgi:hypothetical protein